MQSCLLHVDKLRLDEEQIGWVRDDGRERRVWKEDVQKKHSR